MENEMKYGAAPSVAAFFQQLPDNSYTAGVRKSTVLLDIGCFTGQG